jgi:hypothetical protein
VAVTIDDLPDFAEPVDVENFTKGQIERSDPRVLDAIKAVTSSIRKEAGWHIGPMVTGHTLTLDGPGGKKLNLPTLKLVTLTSITQLGVVLPLDDDSHDWSELGLVEKRDGTCWTDRYRKIVAVMDHGFDDLSDLKFLTLSLVSRGLASPMGATREQAGNMSIQWSTPQAGVSGGLVPLNFELQIMNRYRLEVP